MTLQSTWGRGRLNGDRVEQRIAELAPWFHNLRLPSGHQTAPDHPLGDYPSFKWRDLRVAIPEDLTGWRALDIGCNAGFYSFELARRGAAVLGIDADDHYLRQARWAAELFELDRRIEFRRLQVYDLARLRERFDLVLFMGVLYHLRYPLLALDLVAEKVGRLLVLQTLTMPGEEAVESPADLGIDERERLTSAGWPKMAFLERSLAGDPTNWWAPNHACVEAMVRSAGLEMIARPAHEVYVCRRGATGSPHIQELDAAIGRGLHTLARRTRPPT